MIFQKPKNPLEGHAKVENVGDGSQELTAICPKCKKAVGLGELADAFHVCPYCRYHFRVNARQRVNMTADPGSFEERDGDMVSSNILGFPDYEKKLINAKLESAEKDGVVCGVCTIGGKKTALFVMEPFFMMGSMGSVVGEKITRLFEHAAAEGLPVTGFMVSGGARMQEGVLSLMQMAKTSGAVKRHSDAGGLYICVLTDPTTGGVTASFAMQADVIIAEPFALIGFAGPRVIEQTMRKKLPEGFQRAEFLLEKGFIDIIAGRRRQRKLLAQLLQMHEKGKGGGRP